MRAVAAAVVAWCSAAALHPLIARDPPLVAPPTAPVLALVSGGHASAAASASWSATVVHQASGSPDPLALERGIATARRFDPTLQAPAVYGPIFLRRAGAPDAATRVLNDARVSWPTEPFFPWALGMNAWMDGDPDTAAHWLDVAGELEPTGIHRQAAESLRAR